MLPKRELLGSVVVLDKIDLSFQNKMNSLTQIEETKGKLPTILWQT